MPVDPALYKLQSECDDLVVALDKDRQWPEVQRSIFEWIRQYGVSVLRHGAWRILDEQGHGPGNLQVSAGLCERPTIAWAYLSLEKEGQKPPHLDESANNTVLHRISPVMRLILVREGMQQRIQNVLRERASRCIGKFPLSDKAEDITKPAIAAFDQLREGKITSVTAACHFGGHDLPKKDKMIWRSVFGE